MRASHALAPSSSSSTTVAVGGSHRTRSRRVATGLVIVPVLGVALALTACGSPTSPGGTPDGPTTSSGGSGTKPDCSSDAILSALPGGATMQKFDCAKVGDTEWAAALTNPGNTVFFLRWNGNTWEPDDSDSVCGTASAGLPDKLLTYCEAGPSSSPS